MRLIFFVGLPRAPLRMVLTELHPGTQVASDVGGVQYVRSPYGISVWRRWVRSVLDDMPASEAPSGKWSVWVVATPGDQLQAKRIFRWLGRYRIDEPDRVLGPYDVARYRTLAASRVDDDGQSLALPPGGVGWCVFGDDHTVYEEQQYNPSDDDIAEQ